MSLPKFTYEAPVLDASKPITVRYVLTDEVETNYKTLGFSKFYKSPKVLVSLIVVILSAIATFITFNSPDLVGESAENIKPQMFFLASAAIFAVSFIFCSFEILFIPSRMFNQLLVESFPVRNKSVANWIEARYGVHVEPDLAGELIDDSNVEGDFWVEVDGKLVRFLTVPDEEVEIETEDEAEARKESIKAKIIRVATTDEEEVPFKGELLYDSSGTELKVIISNIVN